ncbi:MAG TPA: carbohydrate kinase family protein [Candidatus Latescibacteria bacterium]|nr:carbohydrate kinase family protein [Candidatus Latescibacterota bacterium]
MRFLLVGQAVADVVVRPADSFPRREHTELVDQIGLFSGGCTLNTALALKKLGFTPDAVTRVGRDTLGEFLMREMERAGLPTYMVKVRGRTSACLVLVGSDGKRSFLYAPGASEELEEGDLPEDLGAWDWVHASGVMKARRMDWGRFFRRAEAQGVVTSVGIEYDPDGMWEKKVRDLLPLDYLFLNRLEGERITGRRLPEEMAEVLRRWGARTVLITLGREGCYIYGEEEGYVRGFHVNEVDGTGAGDAFVAGFLAARARGWGLRDSALVANACGASAVTELGATAGVVGWEEVIRWVQSRRGR